MVHKTDRELQKVSSLTSFGFAEHTVQGYTGKVKDQSDVTFDRF